MKNSFFLIFSFCLASVLAFGQNSFYYYGYGGKHYLTLDDSRVTIAIQRSHITNDLTNAIKSLPVSSSLINDSIYLIYEFKLSGNSHNGIISSEGTGIRSQISEVLNNRDIMLMPCFLSEEGTELTMTNYINVKLKRTEDFCLLSQMADSLHLTIVSQDQFMPLWYILSVNAETGMNSLETANYIFEKGIFACVLPDLAFKNRLSVSHAS